jgi:aspartyl-tRNA(Asn)/glutamyl-tRNA(Gln) amidotransferase subunit A
VIAWSPRLGYVRNLHPEVEAATAKAAAKFAELGARVEEIDPGFADPSAMIATIWGAVSATIVDAVPERMRERMDPDFLSLPRYTLADYLAALQNRAELANAMNAFHRRYDLLLTPQMPLPAFAAGQVVPTKEEYGCGLCHPQSDGWIDWSPYTYPFNLTQQPAASIPCGMSSDGLPIGLQIVGRRSDDHLVLRAARAFEAAWPFQRLAVPRT